MADDDLFRSELDAVHVSGNETLEQIDLLLRYAADAISFSDVAYLFRQTDCYLRGGDLYMHTMRDQFAGDSPISFFGREFPSYHKAVLTLGRQVLWSISKTWGPRLDNAGLEAMNREICERGHGLELDDEFRGCIRILSTSPPQACSEPVISFGDSHAGIEQARAWLPIEYAKAARDANELPELAECWNEHAAHVAHALSKYSEIDLNEELEDLLVNMPPDEISKQLEVTPEELQSGQSWNICVSDWDRHAAKLAHHTVQELCEYISSVALPDCDSLPGTPSCTRYRMSLVAIQHELAHVQWVATQEEDYFGAAIIYRKMAMRTAFLNHASDLLRAANELHGPADVANWTRIVATGGKNGQPSVTPSQVAATPAPKDLLVSLHVAIRSCQANLPLQGNDATAERAWYTPESLAAFERTRSQVCECRDLLQGMSQGPRILDVNEDLSRAIGKVIDWFDFARSNAEEKTFFPAFSQDLLNRLRVGLESLCLEVFTPDLAKSVRDYVEQWKGNPAAGCYGDDGVKTLETLASFMAQRWLQIVEAEQSEGMPASKLKELNDAISVVESTVQQMKEPEAPTGVRPPDIAHTSPPCGGKNGHPSVMPPHAGGDGTDDKNEASTPSPGRVGVTLRQLAMALSENDPEAARQTKNRWKRIPKPESIGKHPKHSQAELYEPVTIVAWAKKIGEPCKPSLEEDLRQIAIRL